MTGEKHRHGRLNLPVDYEYPSLAESFGALRRVLKIAKSAGAHPDDIKAASTWPLIWKLEEIRRHELESDAEIGRKVSSGRHREDHSDRDRRDIEILWCARELLLAGAKSRGLAGKIRKTLRIELSDRQINRILNFGMPIFFNK